MIELRYGDHRQRAELPPGWHVEWIRAALPPAERPASFSMERALDAPIGAPPLQDAVRGGDRVTVAVPDKTRLCRAREFLPAVLDRLLQAGVRREHITLLFATGTHPPQSDAERRSILGEELHAAYRVEEHDSRDASTLVPVGRTSAGTPVSVNRLLLDADLCLATGAIVHHYFAGFGGGAKLFVPGCAAYETAVANHRLTLRDDGSFHPACSDGILDGNPVTEDIREAMRFLPPQYYAGVVLDSRGELHAGVCGHIVDAHAAGTRIIDALYRVEVPRSVDCCVASAGGTPKDLNLIQSHKSIHHAAYAVRDGGCVVVLAECAEGIGNATFLPWFAEDDPAAFRRNVLARYTMNAHTAVALREKTERLTVILVSGLDRHDVRRMGMLPAHSLEEALHLAAARLPSDAHALIVENASLMLPVPPGARPGPTQGD